MQLDKVDVSGKQLLELGQQTEIGVRMFFRAQRFEHHEEIQVAGLPVEFSGAGGAKDVQTFDAKFTTKLLQFFCSVCDFLNHRNLLPVGQRFRP